MNALYQFCELKSLVGVALNCGCSRRSAALENFSGNWLKLCVWTSSPSSGAALSTAQKPWQLPYCHFAADHDARYEELIP